MSLKFCKATVSRIPEALSLSRDIMYEQQNLKREYSFILVIKKKKSLLNIIKNSYCFVIPLEMRETMV